MSVVLVSWMAWCDTLDTRDARNCRRRFPINRDGVWDLLGLFADMVLSRMAGLS